VESSEIVSEPRSNPSVIKSSAPHAENTALPQNSRMNSFRSGLYKPNRSKSPHDPTSSGAMPDQSMLHMIIPQSKHAINRLTPPIEK
jgi:hypothetical protein